MSDQNSVRQEVLDQNARIRYALDKFGDFLCAKNISYDGAIFEPLSIVAEVDPMISVLIKMNDKLKRILSGKSVGENDIQDFIGYYFIGMAMHSDMKPEFLQTPYLENQEKLLELAPSSKPSLTSFDEEDPTNDVLLDTAMAIAEEDLSVMNERKDITISKESLEKDAWDIIGKSVKNVRTDNGGKA